MTQVLDQLLEDIKSVEPLPQVAMRVMEIAAQDDVVPRDLVSVIQTDAGVTAKVLKLCNSALYGFKREIASLPEAGNLLGTATLVNLVLTSCAGRYFRDYGRADASSNVELWEQSIATAFAASWIAARHGRVDRNRAYTVGLLENIGRLVLSRFAHLQDDELWREMAHGRDLLESERELFGMDHAEIGARLADKWGFPPLLVDAIRHHHEPRSAQVDAVMASVGHAAEMFVDRSLRSAERDEPRYTWSAAALTECGIEPEQLDGLQAQIRDQLGKARAILDIA